MTQYRNEPSNSDTEENEFDELDKEFFFSVLVSVSILFTVVVLACAAAWFLTK